MMKYVYLFSEGTKEMRGLLGGKGANLAEMKNMGLKVPDGFTVSTEACHRYYLDKETINENLEKQIMDALHSLEKSSGKVLGDASNPLLLSVRSGSPISMPGMMDTILNLGMNDEIAKNMAKKSGNTRFVYDSYRRLILMFADVVKGYDKEPFERLLELKKESKNTKSDLDLTDEDMYDIAMGYKELYKKLSGSDFPENPKAQLLEAIKAVFKSWNNDRAKVYRKMNNISDNLGTAVNIQEMVYGNLSDSSLTGVAFSRNPSTGENKLYGEFLEKAQGEDIVAGVRTPKSIEAMERDFPNIYKELNDIAKILEKHYGDMQDMEFTVEDGKLYMLQTRNAKRTALASVKTAVSLVDENVITKEEAIMRVEADELNRLLHPAFDEKVLKTLTPISKGLPASPGAAIGKICFNKESVINSTEKTILVRTETSPEDIEGMKDAEGILTVRGGMTSHAAVVARGIGKCCISGASDIYVDEVNKTITVGDKILHEGDIISLDGSTGNVYEGSIPLSEVKISEDFETFMNFAKEFKKLGVRANADTKEDALAALNFGAEGIGLCRTEHMFFEEDKIFAVRKMIIADNTDDRDKALAELLPMQQKDFEELFTCMNDKVVTIRLIDPPLHEFLPKTKEDLIKLSKSLNVSLDTLEEKVSSLKEFNPMMGHRGCRLSITYPEITMMQVTAIIKAAIKVAKKGIKVTPEIMVPLIGDVKEYEYLEKIIKATARNLISESDVNIDYKIGTMIEVPRSVILADEIAKKAEFFSFGTNDLTQMTYGFSRDDAGKFLNDYYEKGIFANDPFKTIDTEGVGKLVEVGVTLAKRANPNIHLGICGEHGGDEKSIEFFNKVGLDYVSCSPYRVPSAILASAKAAVKERNK